MAAPATELVDGREASPMQEMRVRLFLLSLAPLAAEPKGSATLTVHREDRK
jgi:hypothetical protein